MAEVTVKQLAQVVGTPVDRLLVQLGDAGVPKSGEEDMISDSEKLTLLTHLQKARGKSASTGASKKITLKRKRVSELPTDSSGRKKVNVEVRARRTYVRPGDDASASAKTPVSEAPVAETAVAEEPAARADSKDSVEPADTVVAKASTVAADDKADTPASSEVSAAPESSNEIAAAAAADIGR
jgi:translation initiation factor IF-2